MTTTPVDLDDFLYEIFADTSFKLTLEEGEEGGTTSEYNLTRSYATQSGRAEDIVGTITLTLDPDSLTVAIEIPEKYQVGLPAVFVKLHGPNGNQIAYLENDGSACFDLEEIGEYHVRIEYDDEAPHHFLT